MRTSRLLAIGMLGMLMAGAAPALADSPHSNLSLTMSGAILDSGSQSYYHTGGHLVSALIGGVPLAADHAVLHYSLQATVSELSVAGFANFSLTAPGSHGNLMVVSGSAVIGDMMAAESFPLGCSGASCTSGIPGIFLGLGSVLVQSCHGDEHADHCTTVLQEQVPMEFESAFLNPFGGPIFFTTADGAVYVVADYSQSRVTWAGIQLGGTISGNLAGSPVSGSFAMTVAATEDLKAGYELDHGTIVFSSATPALNAAGSFVGRSTIPPGDSSSPLCSPFPAGTCQITGFGSAGVFSQTNGLGQSIRGTYSTTWIAPAVAFSSSVSAMLKTSES